MATISKEGTNLGEGVECKGSIPSFFIDGDTVNLPEGFILVDQGELDVNGQLFAEWLLREGRDSLVIIRETKSENEGYFIETNNPMEVYYTNPLNP